jgi:O-antigen ligase
VTSDRLRAQLEGALQALTGALVVWLVLAVGNARPWNIPVGRTVRWVVLAEFAAAALLLAVVSRRGRLPAAFVLLVSAFLALALLSSLWSADVVLSLGRFATLATVFATCGALAALVAARRDLSEVLMVGLTAGVVVLAVTGLIELWVDPDRAVVPATTQSPARYNGIGGNPNTMAMLIAIVVPATAWASVAAPTRARRVVALAALGLLYGSLVASGSRGSLLGAMFGTLVYAALAPLERRRKLATAGSAVALFAIGIVALEFPQPADRPPVIPYDIVPPPPQPLGPLDAQQTLPLEAEIGLPSTAEEPYVRSLFTTSGRLDAWGGALEQALDRPLLGYGFGSEERVFVDRYFLHYSQRPENAYLGTLLQLGAAGLLLLVALLASVVAHVRFVRDGPTAACAGAVVCGLVLASSQSYLTSVGSPAMAPFWLSVSLLVGATSANASRRLSERESDEREIEAAQRNAEAGLNVMGREHDGVGGERDDDAKGRAPASHHHG